METSWWIFLDATPSFSGKEKKNQCFKWAVTIGLKKLFSQHPERVNSDLIEQSKEFNCSCVSFPTKVDEIWKFEKINDVSVNVYCWNEFIVPLKGSEEKERHVDLLLMTNEKTEDSHYCVVKNFSKLVSSQLSKHDHKVFVCKRCLCKFKCDKELTIRKFSCGKFSPVKVKMPPKGNKVEFKSFHK